MRINRRDFLLQGGMAAGLGAAARGVSLVAAADDPVASAGPVRWALGELEDALAARRIAVRTCERLSEAAAGDLCIVAAGLTAPAAREALAGALAPAGPEVVALAPGSAGGRHFLLAGGSDVRGLVYAVLELADRVRHAGDPLAALAVPRPAVERPANTIRSITRCFVSDVEDKSWYNDRAMWPPYLSMLAAQRFNRFSFATGIGYDFPRNVRDCYLHFPYPFLLAVPGYNVRATGVSEAERDRNLDMLKFIGEETARRGLQFQFAIWTHAYEWVESPEAKYLIEGLTPASHAAYCREGLRMILEAVPAITGVTFRVHGESGVPEGSYDFWKAVFEGIVRSGRRIEIDMHAKGMDSRMVETALSTGLPVNISPKYWAEHMGLPYHQAAIRELEMPPRERKDDGFFALSNGSRRFLRYGYGDLLSEDRRYGVLHRIWPGTQRVLLWGDPVTAAAYGRASSFCGSAGIEICEPLSFKGRKGSGLPGGRCAYADASLAPRYDWEKYLYTYRVWGRLLYNPDADPDTYRRYLRAQFGAGAAAAESALSHAGRILPLVTTAHGVSGSNNAYWPEMYVNMPVVDAGRRHPYSDTPAPKVFGTVSPFDPGLFLCAEDAAAELLMQVEPSARYSPTRVAAWLEDLADTAARQLAEAEKRVAARSPEFRRFAVDVAIESSLGRFFAAKMRSAVLFAIYNRTGVPAALEEALKAYRAAREAWAGLARRAQGVYRADVTYGYDRHLRGHWSDRLAAIDEDIADMQALAGKPVAARGDAERTRRAIQAALGRPARPSVAARHTPPARFTPGRAVELELAVEGQPRAVRLRYRRVNQEERWRTTGMEARGGTYRAAIPAAYTESPFPLQYLFELHEAGAAFIYPGLGPALADQPYFVVRRG